MLQKIIVLMILILYLLKEKINNIYVHVYCTYMYFNHELSNIFYHLKA